MTEEECNVCIESFTAKKPGITCPHCQAQTCRVCVKRYLIESIQTAHCMACKKAWSNKFISDNLPKSWIHSDYRKSRQKLYVDRETAMLPQTMGVLQERITREKLEADFVEQLKKVRARRIELKEKMKEMRLEMANLIATEGDIYHSISTIRNGHTAKLEEPKYIFPCTKANCRGFIEAQKWKCCLCETKICKSCHVIKIKDQEHKCKKEDIETAKMIVKETKPCPSCKSRIFKISGCDQIFCTSCHTAFSWEKGTIETGVIHNPHYFELQQKLGVVQRNVRDVPCGGIDHYHVFAVTRNTNHNNFFRNVVERVGEVNNHITRLTDKDFLETRIAYLRGALTKSDFRSAIFRIERGNEKRREERQILETFRVSVIERLNNLTNENIMETKKDIQRILDFCNMAFEENYAVLGYKTWPQIDIAIHYGR
jgi:DNA-directed RNA polymerase beta subunit